MRYALRVMRHLLSAQLQKKKYSPGRREKQRLPS